MHPILTALQHHARERPSAMAVQGADRSLTYQVLWREVELLAAQLSRAGQGVVGLLADNGPEWLVMDLAAAYADRPLVPIPAFFSAGQLAHTLEDAGIRSLFTDQADYLGSLELRNQQPLEICDTRWQQLDLQVEEKTPRFPPATAKLSYTSGTTGTPKGVCLSSEAMCLVAESLRARTAVSETDHHLCLLPLATLLENIAGVYVPLLAGARVCVPPLAEVGLRGGAGVDIQRLLCALESYRATRAILLPQMLQEMVEALEEDGGLEQAAGLRFLAVGGAPVAHSLLTRATGLGLPVYEGYGLSECASVVAVNAPAADRPGTVGKPLPHVRLDFAADGEILVSGACFQGYLGAMEAPAADPWPTGDLGFLDDEGYLHLSGRKKNMFITSFGRNVVPEWVERELVLQPSIHQAAVFGEGRPWNVAVVVKAAGTDNAMVDAAITVANRALPDYAQVRSWVPATEAFQLDNEQLTATGRLRRAVIREIYAPLCESLYQDGEQACNKEEFI